MSPQIATVRRWMRPLARRMVRASSSACVGCSCRPSPAFRTAQSTFCASRLTAPEDGCRTTSRSGCMAFSVSAVSISVSPFFTLECPTDMFITSAPSRLPASSKVAWVRVEASKNMLIWVMPRSALPCFSVRRFRSTYVSDRSRTVRMSSGERCSIPRRWRARKVMGPSSVSGLMAKARTGVHRQSWRRFTWRAARPSLSG